jgi:VanZ family protein
MTPAQFVRYWLPVILWMAVVFLLSSDQFSAQHTSLIVEPILRFLLPQVSDQTIEMAHLLVRKSGHLLEYFVLGVLLFRAFRGGSADSPVHRHAFAAATVLLLYAASDELHQVFVPGRTPSPLDVLIDFTGGLLGITLITLMINRLSRQAETEPSLKL